MTCGSPVVPSSENPKPECCSLRLRRSTTFNSSVIARRWRWRCVVAVAIATTAPCAGVCVCVDGVIFWPPGTAEWPLSAHLRIYVFTRLICQRVVWGCRHLHFALVCFNFRSVPSRIGWLKFWAWLMSLPPLHNFFAHSFTIAFISLTRRHKRERTQIHARWHTHTLTHSVQNGGTDTTIRDVQLQLKNLLLVFCWSCFTIQLLHLW